MNSWKHGLCAEQLLIPGDVPTYYKGQPVLEDPEKLLDELMDKMYEELNPQGLLEGAFAAEVVGCLVRLRRVKHHEAAIMRSHYDEDALEASGESPFPAGIQWLADINLLSVYEKRIMSNLRYFRQELASAKLERMREEYARMQMELQARNYAIGNAESATQRRENAHGSGPAELMHNAQRTAHRSNGTNEPNEPELHPSSVASNVDVVLSRGG